jgi:hypothetical protein
MGRGILLWLLGVPLPVHAPGGKLYAIGGRRSEPCFAVPFRSDGERMVQLSSPGTEHRYLRLKTKLTGGA